MRVEDLPPKLRAQVVAAAEAGDVEEPARRRTRRTAPGPGPRYRCHACGAEFARYGAAAERHVDEAHGGGRLEAILST